MYPLLSFFIFIFVLFLYIHITAQWKKSDDLEIYETDYQSPNQIQEICSVKQPVLFKLDSVCPKFFDKFQLSKMTNYDNHDVHIKDLHDYASTTSVDSVKLPLRSAINLTTSDTNARYFSESNTEYLEETGFDALCHSLDDYLKPAFTIQRKYDIGFGSSLACTPLRYHMDHQMFLIVTQGKLRIKMAPPKFSKYLEPIRDYENYEFRSRINPWTRERQDRQHLQDLQHNQENLEKCRFLDFEVYPGYALFIPSYWWYSICISENTTWSTIQYNTIANVLAHVNHLGMHYLQVSNVFVKPAKKYQPIPPQERIEPVLEPIIEKKSGNAEIVTNAGIYKTTGEIGDIQ